MTELTEPDNVPAQPAPDWPEARGQDITDPQVAQAVARLLDVPRLPTADHEAVYNGLHDDLLAALNGDPADGGPSGAAPAGGEA
ncbi:hypothetical protein ACFFGR_08335 [Arthrobacter liuii]|uniref:Uncharacterized protein n=1 Tax=Arthrobacter liuii TaxID=1476996 RepID=A0ABQ2AUE5_9MICC|nr:hypothetical protein [Arthrobacter liuii]GGH97366.1 hypothetical protein GCM10007170_27440 [Arthrobacter liuii]